MEQALYDQDYGYYMTHRVEPDQSSRGPIGWNGDFYTASEFSPILAKTLVRQALEIDALLDEPSTFTFVEMGGGNGTFAADFLQQCKRVAPDFLSRLRYVLVERSPSLQARQKTHIREMMGQRTERQTCWVPSLEQLDADSVIGMLFSNELVDAFPVHRVRFKPPDLQEIYVAYENGQFVERLGPLSSPYIENYVQRHCVKLQEGQVSEIHVAAELWISSLARVLSRGIVITIDYGHTGSDYYGAARKKGTFICYFRHTVSTNPYIRIGEQDMTSHVNFSVLAHAGKENALLPLGFTNMANWLMGLGVEEFVEDENLESADVQALSQLLRPHGMGTTFKVLVQQKGLESVSLQGLRYPAFFNDVL